MYKIYFKEIRELVDHQTYFDIGDRAWDKIDYRLLVVLNKIKERYGYTMIINTWFMGNWQRFGEMREYSGLRPSTVTVGKPDGAHYRGMASDILFFDKAGNYIKADTIRALLMADIESFPYLMCLEIGIEWVHIDVMSELDHPKRIGANAKNLILVDTKNNVTWFDRKEKVIKEYAA